MKNIILIVTIASGILYANSNDSKNREIQPKKEILAKKTVSPKVAETKEKIYPRGTIASH